MRTHPSESVGKLIDNLFLIVSTLHNCTATATQPPALPHSSSAAPREGERHPPRGKTCWGEGDHDHRANREIERGVHLTLHSLPAAGGQAGEGRPLRCIGSGRGGTAGCGSRHPPLGGCSGIASTGYWYRSGHRSSQRQHASADLRRYEQDALDRSRRLMPCCAEAADASGEAAGDGGGATVP